MRGLSPRFRSLSAVAGAFIATAAPVQSQTREPYPGLGRYVEASRQEWHVPRAAIAIVHNDSVIYAKGYGVRELGKSDRVVARTIFAIGSNTKAFTAAAIEMLVDEGKIDLDAPVSVHIPGFRLSDPLASEQVDVRDLLAHRTGVVRNKLRQSPRDWSHELKMAADSVDGLVKAAEAAFVAQRVPNTKPTLPLAAYAGTYAGTERSW